jgi:hypothetical protein
VTGRNVIANHAAFTGLGKRERMFDADAWPAIWDSVDLDSTDKAKQNSQAGAINHLWSASFWNENVFACRGEFRQRRKFLRR